MSPGLGHDPLASYNNTIVGNAALCLWQQPQHILFQLANFCFALSYSAPSSKKGILFMHSVLIIGFMLLSGWAWHVICAPDIFSWNFTFLILNIGQLVYIVYQMRPVRFDPELEEVYHTLFFPFKVSRMQFKRLVSPEFATIMSLHAGEAYAMQNLTRTDRLGLLLSGKINVLNDSNFLHPILPCEFLDSPEFESSRACLDDKFKVSIVAASSCRYLYWQRSALEYLLVKEAYLATVLTTLVARDIATKLYAMNSKARKVMARTTRSERKMANTSDAETAPTSLMSNATSNPFIDVNTSSSYATEGYSFNHTEIVNGLNIGYSLDDLNYTELWIDVWNRTESINVTTRLNATVLPQGSYCDEWEAAQHKLFQAANLFFAAAFLVPRSFKASVLALRTFLTAGFMLAALWAGITICALDAMLWCLALGLLNGIHSLILACRFLPPALSPELAELYLKLFKPYRVSKKHFQELAKEARILKLDPGQTYATEGVSPADERLSILLRGKLKVTCESTHLHYIRAYQFVDSPEWEATHENLDDVFQVTIRAEESSTYICWTRLKLLRVLRHRPLLKVVLNTLIGKDITSKLYALNEQLAGVAAAHENAVSNPYRGIARSVSVDAVDTESAGRVRSSTWKERVLSHSYSNSPQHYGQQYWSPVVANHFPPTSPFLPTQNPDYTILPQSVTISPPPRVPNVPTHSPLTRQRSVGGGPGGDYTLLPTTPKLERKRSKKTAREVTFETPV